MLGKVKKNISKNKWPEVRINQGCLVSYTVEWYHNITVLIVYLSRCVHLFHAVIYFTYSAEHIDLMSLFCSKCETPVRYNTEISLAEKLGCVRKRTCPGEDIVAIMILASRPERNKAITFYSICWHNSFLQKPWELNYSVLLRLDSVC